MPAEFLDFWTASVTVPWWLLWVLTLLAVNLVVLLIRLLWRR